MSMVGAAVPGAGQDELPSVFGRYLLLKRLSRGGMGEIFLAKLGEIQGFEKLVIIKKILPNLAADQEFIKRFIDEAQVAIKLNHANIAPPNVMLSFEGECKIIDFGIAKSAIRIAGTNPNMGFGKFGYMAPEQLIRGGIVDRRTDVYAAGVVLYELLTGERLFIFPEGADYRAIARMVTAGKFKPPSQRDPRLDPDLDKIVMRALASQKDDRYQTAEEFRDG